MIGNVIVLTTVEQKICEALAIHRHKNNRSSGVRNSKIGGQSNELTDLEGIAAEFAFCKLFNLYPDFSILPRSATDGTDKGDMILPSGQTVDVKTTRYNNGRLLAVTWKTPKIDLFALMVGKFPEYEFRGFMKSTELIQKKRLGDLGHGPTYIAQQYELKDLDEVLYEEGISESNSTTAGDDFEVSLNTDSL